MPIMPIAEQDIVRVDQAPMDAAEAFFLPEVFRGLGTTFKHMITRRRGRRSR